MAYRLIEPNVLAEARVRERHAVERPRTRIE